ncbi:MAG: hypothetical protein KKA60_00515 [Proteobacteria bacterium]|nr:hypothetical protein [Pseudomonadota bacterium]
MEIKVKVGEKISEEEAKTLDPSKKAVLVNAPPKTGDVEGQAPYRDMVMCPCCYNVGWAWLDTEYYIYVQCGRCGCSFKA